MTGANREIRGSSSGKMGTDDPRVPRAFLADLRHDLRTPLNAVIGYSEMLIEDAKAVDDEILISELEKIHSAANTLLECVKSMLDPLKIENGQITPSLERYGEQLLQAVHTPIGTVVETSKGIIEKAGESGLDRLIPDMERILSAGNRFLTQINGIGRFKKDENGTIDTDRQTFDAWLLRERGAGHTRSQTDDVAQSHTIGRSLLLVVDDNAENRHMLSRYLSRHGHDVMAAGNGRQALDLIKEHPVDLVLLDIKMPDMNGFQVLYHLKSDKAWQNLPVIMISALDDMDSVVRCIEMGAEDYLIKPFDPVLLKARISSSLEKKRLREKEVSFMKEKLEIANMIKESLKKTISNVVEGTRSEYDFEWIVPYMKKACFEKGAYLFHKGDKADRMYYLKQGRLRLVELDLILTAGNVLGETGIFSPKKERTISAVCEEASEICYIEENETIELFNEKPSLLFELVQISIQRNIENLTATVAEKERTDTDLRVAHDIQKSMLPRVFPPFPDRKELDIFASMEAAREVGGDFFDFYFIDEDKLCFTIGDVSGKGVPASLFMAIAKTILKIEALRGLSPGEILSNANRLIAPENHTAMFVTILCAILNTKTGEVEFANAGHNPALISKNGADFEFNRVPPNFVCGTMEDVSFSSEKTVLHPNDVVFFYTDGVTEAMDSANRMYSEQRLQACLSNFKGAGVTEMIRGVREDIQRFVQPAPQSDDITMLAVKYNGPGQ